MIIQNSFDQSDWLAWIRAEGFFFNLQSVLSEIKTDDEYVRFRERLDTESRRALDKERFLFALASDKLQRKDRLPNFSALAFAPPNLLDLDLADLDLNTRVSNALTANRLNKVSQLVTLGTEGLLTIENLGKKSLFNLFETVCVALLEHINAETPTIEPMDHSLEPDATENDIKIPEAGNATPVAEVLTTGTDDVFLDRISAAIDTLPEKAKQIILGRLGLTAPQKTLEELASPLMITRERVRQIEKKSWLKIRKSTKLNEDFTSAVRSLLTAPIAPIWCPFLSLKDSRFSGLENQPHSLNYLLEKLSDVTAHVIRVNEQMAFSFVSQDDFYSLVKGVADRLREAAKRRASRTEIRLMIEAMCLDRRCHELATEVYSAFEPRLRFGTSQFDGEEELLAFSTGADSLILPVLERSDMPLHFSEVWRQVQELSDKSIQVTSVQNKLINDPVIFLLGRGTYGVWRHVGVSDEDSQEIVDDVETIIFSSSASRQWHTQELLDTLSKTDDERYESLDRYRLNAILRSRTTKLKYLGRMTWCANSSQYQDTGDRIDIRQACAALIRDAGRPLTRKELQDALRAQRGISEFFQLANTEDLVRVGLGLWGLRSRDLSVDVTQIKSVIDALYQMLEIKNKGLHHTEITTRFIPRHSESWPELNSHMLTGLALEDDRFIPGDGGYIGLKAWGNCRRLSLAQCARELIDFCNGRVSTKDAARYLEGLLGRPVPTSDVAGALRSTDWRFNHSAGFWEWENQSESEIDSSTIS